MSDEAPEWVECAFCGEAMEPVGWDPCSVEVWAAREVDGHSYGWSFGAHARCIVAAFHQDFRTDVAEEYKFPPGE